MLDGRPRGNAIVISGTTLSIIGLTFGGSRYAWDDAHVLAPLIVGLVLIAVFILYEARIPDEPTIPWEVMSNRTTVGGYAQPAHFHDFVSHVQ